MRYFLPKQNVCTDSPLCLYFIVLPLYFDRIYPYMFILLYFQPVLLCFFRCTLVYTYIACGNTVYLSLEYVKFVCTVLCILFLMFFHHSPCTAPRDHHAWRFLPRTSYPVQIFLMPCACPAQLPCAQIPCAPDYH